jgi:hypothetical protein
VDRGADERDERYCGEDTKDETRQLNGTLSYGSIATDGGVLVSDDGFVV